MQPITVFKDLKKLGNDWNKTLEKIISSAPEKDKQAFRAYNEKRKHTRYTGFDVQQFAKMFQLGTYEAGPMAMTALFFTGIYLDDYYDEHPDTQDIGPVILEDFDNFCKTGNASTDIVKSTRPFVDYIRDTFGKKYDAFIPLIKKSIDISAMEFKNLTPDQREEVRYKMGETFGEVMAFTLDATSNASLQPYQHSVIEKIGTALMLLDDIADVHQDACSGVSYLIHRQSSLDVILWNQLKKVRKLCSDGYSLLNTKHEKNVYKNLVDTTALVYVHAFLKNQIKYTFRS